MVTSHHGASQVSNHAYGRWLHCSAGSATQAARFDHHRAALLHGGDKFAFNPVMIEEMSRFGVSYSHVTDRDIVGRNGYPIPPFF